jgi:hypothetical protein
MSSATEPDGPRPLDWAGLVLLVLCGALAALLETLLVPLYVGSVIVPISVLLAVLSNVALPRMARTLVPRTAAAGAPFLAWLVVVIGFGVLTRPEGDVVLPGSPTGAELVTYGLLAAGVIAGTATVAITTPPPASRPDLNR